MLCSVCPRCSTAYHVRVLLSLFVVFCITAAASLCFEHTRAAGSLCYFFVSIFSRFHQPSKRISHALAAFIVCYLAVSATLYGYGLVTNTSHSVVAHYILPISAVYLVVLLCMAAVYGFAVLRPPTNASVLRAQSREEETQRQYLWLAVKTVITAFLVFIGLFLFGALLAISSSSVTLHLIFGFLAQFACALLEILFVFIMGRVPASKKATFSSDSAAAGPGQGPVQVVVSAKPTNVHVHSPANINSTGNTQLTITSTATVDHASSTHGSHGHAIDH